jgi:phage shock protein PspC (stress-responsive transcriptional regulator)
MTSPYPPYQGPPYPGPRKLERSRSNRVLGGVCGGVAQYANMDPTLVRVLTVVIAFFTGVPIILYLIALFVIPEEDPNKGPQSYPRVNGPQWSYGAHPQDNAEGLVPPAQPSYAPRGDSWSGSGSGYGRANAPSEDSGLWGPEGAPWEQGSKTPPPSSAPGGSQPDQPTYPPKADDELR